MKYILVLTIFVHGTLCSQTKKLVGWVEDASGTPIAGATIAILNTSSSTSTNKEGAFTIAYAGDSASIVISHINFATIVKTLSAQDSSIHIVMYQSDKQLSEVVVIAGRKEEAILKVPTSVTVLTSQRVKDLRVWSMNDLTAIVPNFKYADLGVGYQSQIAIRGISIFSETPSTATYIDGVAALDVTGTGLQLMDIESIEVLRGPQGTLYGRNAMGGVVNITTRKATSITKGFAEISMGNQGLQRYGGGLHTPIVKNKLLLSVSGQYQKRKGFYTNDLSEATVFSPVTMERYSLKGTPEDGIRVGDEESYYGNLSLKYIVNNKFNISFNNIFQEEHSVGASAYYMAVPTNEIAVKKPHKFMVNDLGSHQRKLYNGSFNGVYYGNRATITSTTAIQHILQAYHHIDQDLLPDNAAFGSSYARKIGAPYPQTVFSQEIRIQSSIPKKVNWIAGAYFFNQQFNKQYAAVYKDLALLLGMTPGTQITKTDFHNSGAALYGQADYGFWKYWKFTTGLRVDFEKRNINVARYYLDENGTRNYDINDTTMRSKFSALSPKVVLQYIPADNQQAYISYSRGFRAGGNNLFTKGKYLSYDPEYSNNFELGYKIKTWENRIRISAALFYLYWKNMQLDLNPEPGYWIVDNVGNVTSYGAEFEMAAIPLIGLQVDASLGITKATYGNFSYLGKNIKGHQAIMSPDYTAMLGLQQLFPLTKKVYGSIRGEYRSIGSQYFDLANEIYQPAYNLLNARLTIYYRKAELALWLQNITNERFITFAMPGYFKHSVINRPKSIGITLRHHF